MDIIFVYKCLNSLHACSLTDVGLSLVESVTRGNGVRLVQRKGGALFSQRAPRTWNALPVRVVTATNISSFKQSFLTFYLIVSNVTLFNVILSPLFLFALF